MSPCGKDWDFHRVASDCPKLLAVIQPLQFLTIRRDTDAEGKDREETQRFSAKAAEMPSGKLTKCLQTYYKLLTKETQLFLAKSHLKYSLSLPNIIINMLLKMGERQRQQASWWGFCFVTLRLIVHYWVSLWCRVFYSLPLVCMARNHREVSANLQKDISIPSFHRWVVPMVVVVAPALSSLPAPRHGY